jgi:hypothetical protein
LETEVLLGRSIFCTSCGDGILDLLLILWKDKNATWQQHNLCTS